LPAMNLINEPCHNLVTTFPQPCHNLATTLPEGTTLLASRCLAKSGKSECCSTDYWQTYPACSYFYVWRRNLSTKTKIRNYKNLPPGWVNVARNLAHFYWPLTAR